MKLLFITICYKNGIKDVPELHYWDTNLERWELVPCVECKTWEMEKRLTDEDI